MPQAHQTVAGLFVPRQILGGIRKETTEGWPKKKDDWLVENNWLLKIPQMTLREGG